jgi:HEAT repeat protein
MKDQTLSREQMELQKRIAQRRIERINGILASGVQPPACEPLDSDTVAVIARLYDTSLSEADLSSCISILEMLLLLEALPPLLNVMKSETYSTRLRRQAAEAIARIGSKDVADELVELLSSASPLLRSFAQSALK